MDGKRTWVSSEKPFRRATSFSTRSMLAHWVRSKRDVRTRQISQDQREGEVTKVEQKRTCPIVLPRRTTKACFKGRFVVLSNSS